MLFHAAVALSRLHYSWIAHMLAATFGYYSRCSSARTDAVQDKHTNDDDDDDADGGKQVVDLRSPILYV